MRIGDLYIPDLIAEEILADSYSVSGSGIIRTSLPVEKTPTTAAPETKTDPAMTIMWIGAATSMGGLGLELAKYAGQRKR